MPITSEDVRFRKPKFRLVNHGYYLWNAFLGVLIGIFVAYFIFEIEKMDRGALFSAVGVLVDEI